MSATRRVPRPRPVMGKTCNSRVAEGVGPAATGDGCATNEAGHLTARSEIAPS